jgi:hypothetical protein
MPAQQEPVPAALHHRDLRAQIGTKLRLWRISAESIEVHAESGWDYDITLFPLDGALLGNGYVATRVAVGKRYDPLIGEGYWTLAAECSGSLVLHPRGFILALKGPTPCTVLRGEFRVPVPEPVAPAAAKTPTETDPCTRYRDCYCELAKQANAKGAGERLAKLAEVARNGCSEAESLLRTAERDARACNYGLTMTGALVRELTGVLVTACQ